MNSTENNPHNHEALAAAAAAEKKASDNQVVKVEAPEGVTSATVAGVQYHITEHGHFLMKLEHALAMAEHGFKIMVEKIEHLIEGDPAAGELGAGPAHGGAGDNGVQVPPPADEGNGDPAAAPATTPGESGAPAPAAETAGETTPSSSTETPGAEPDDTMLLGSSVQPSTWTLEDGTIMQLGTVVAEAQKRLGCTAKEWNELADADRESLIQSVVDELPLPKAEIANLENEGGKPAPEKSEGNEGGDGVSAAPAPDNAA